MDRFVGRPAAAEGAGDDLAHQERVLVCVWNVPSTTTESTLLSRIRSESSFPQAPSAKLYVDDVFYEKTSVVLTGIGSHDAALRLIALPPGAEATNGRRGSPSGPPWGSVTEHTKSWFCPRKSCAGAMLNIRGRYDCQHCRMPRPSSLKESRDIWRREMGIVMAGQQQEDQQTAAAMIAPAAAGQSATSTAAPAQVGPTPKRARFTGTGIQTTINTAHHPNANDERVRLVVWDPSDANSTDQALASTITSVLASRNCIFRGTITVTDKWRDKTVIALVGAGAHQAALALDGPPRGIFGVIGGTNRGPWRNCSEHDREWHCPRLSCIVALGDRFNIDNGEFNACCQNCGGGRPSSLVESADIWRQELERSLENDSSALLVATNNNIGHGGSSSSGGSGIRAVTPSNAAQGAAAADIQQVVAQPPTITPRQAQPATGPRQHQPRGEFGIWKAAITDARYDPSIVLGNNKIFLNKAKDLVKAMLIANASSRIWAFDTNPTNGAKGWIWSDCIDTFLDTYLKIVPEKRHAYEVIGQSDACRMVYDLDMYIGDGVNAGKNDVQMAKDIIKETRHVLKESWTLGGMPSFQEEVLVAHGPSKRSYHIIVKACDENGNEVLLKEFNACKTVANKVNDAFGDKIQVDRKPGHGNKANPEPGSFIDLGIYTKDRPFRLVLSCKMTSPDRPFVDGRRSAYGYDERDERTMVLDTLVVPPHAKDSQVIDINAETSSVTANIPQATGQNAASSIRHPPGPEAIGGGTRDSQPKTNDDPRNVPAVNVPAVDGGIRSGAPSSPAQYESDTDFPLLDYGKGKIASKIHGRDIPRPFNTLVPWVEALAAGLPDAKKMGFAINESRYEYSETESYIHFTLNRNYASHCYCIGRAHAENNVMISIDLFRSIAYQRCWDATCKDPANKSRAKRVLSTSPPAGAMPTKEQIEEYERTAYMNVIQ